MPRILDRVLDCAIYLYETETDARAGKRSGGSGFLFKMPFDHGDPLGQRGGPGATYAVSNWHVASVAPTIRLTTASDEIDVISASTDQWIRHPDQQTDLAVLPLEIEHGKHRIAALAPGHLVTREQMRVCSIGIGDDAFIVGRFVNHEGEQRNQPTVRFGAIAQMPGDLIYTDVGGQDAYLVEIRSIAGYSGSPVIALIPSDRVPGFESLKLALKREYNLPRAFMLLGIDCAHMIKDEPVYEQNNPEIPTRFFVKSNTGMAIVIAAWKLMELLDTKKLRRMRERSEREFKKRTAHTQLDVEKEATRRTIKTGAQIPIPTKDKLLNDLQKTTRKRKPSSRFDA